LISSDPPRLALQTCCSNVASNIRDLVENTQLLRQLKLKASTAASAAAAAAVAAAAPASHTTAAAPSLTVAPDPESSVGLVLYVATLTWFIPSCLLLAFFFGSLLMRVVFRAMVEAAKGPPVAFFDVAKKAVLSIGALIDRAATSSNASGSEDTLKGLVNACFMAAKTVNKDNSDMGAQAHLQLYLRLPLVSLLDPCSCLSLYSLVLALFLNHPLQCLWSAAESH
jgi:hypothetical protein